MTEWKKGYCLPQSVFIAANQTFWLKPKHKLWKTRVFFRQDGSLWKIGLAESPINSSSVEDRSQDIGLCIVLSKLV